MITQIQPAEISDSPILEANDLTKLYEDGVLALDRLSLRVRAGEIYVMLGANGAGKTTTINLFLNFIEPTHGEARIMSVVSHKEPLKAKQFVAYVSENVMLYPYFTACQNLDYFTKLGGHLDYSHEDYCDILKRVGLQEEYFDRKLKNFSKGMRQKCGIAIAILKDTPAILLDEPTSGLDPKAGHEFVELLLELRDNGKAIFMASHDIFRAKSIADTIGIMSQGTLITQRTKNDFVNDDLEQLYLHYMEGVSAA